MNELDILKAQHAEMRSFLIDLRDGWTEEGHGSDDWCVAASDLIEATEPPK